MSDFVKDSLTFPDIEPLLKRIDIFPNGILIANLDENFDIVYANQGYYDMIGYNRAEYCDIFNNSAVIILHPDEARAIIALAKQQLDALFKFRVRAKLRHRLRGFIWADISGNLHVQDNGIRLLYITAVDISEHMLLLEQLKKEKSFNDLIADLSDEAFFDCDVFSGTMSYSKNFANALGVESFPTDYIEAFKALGLLSSDYLNDRKNSFLDNLQEGHEQELHFTLPEGNTIWYLCRCHVSKNALGVPMRIVGKLVDITRHKIQIDELSTLAQHDQLTGLLNKATTELRIKETLNMRRRHDASYALLIIDIDNFKTVNDKLGHLYGDAVLTQLAENLRALFRSNDIVGRVGGDEFFVFLKNYRSKDIILQKANDICTLFRKTYTENDAFVTISASIGIALCPLHSTEFDDLYKKADAALYNSKASGKNTVSFYSEGIAEPYVAQRTEIDANSSKKSFKNNRIEYVFRLLYDSENPASSIQSVLQLVAESYGFSRGYIFESSADGDFTSNTFEWHTNNVTSEISNLQNLPIASIASANAAFLKSGMFILKSISGLTEAEQNILAPQGILSMFQFGIMDMGKLVGFIGFDDCVHESTPTDTEIDEICTVCHVLATFLLKHRSLEREAKQREAVETVMEHMDRYIYVIDPATHNVLYENQKVLSLVGGECVGQKCYNAYCGLSQPCSNCPLRNLAENKAPHTSIITNGAFKVSASIEASYIDWAGNVKAVLLCGRKIKPTSAEAL